MQIEGFIRLERIKPKTAEDIWKVKKNASIRENKNGEEESEEEDIMETETTMAAFNVLPNKQIFTIFQGLLF